MLLILWHLKPHIVREDKSKTIPPEAMCQCLHSALEHSTQHAHYLTTSSKTAMAYGTAAGKKINSMNLNIEYEAKQE